MTTPLEALKTLVADIGSIGTNTHLIAYQEAVRVIEEMERAQADTTTKPQTAIPRGSVSYLPAYCGDGYNYGGGIIVSFGKFSLSLGGLNPTSGYDESAIALARVISAAPDLLDGCNAILGLLQLISGRDDVSDDLQNVLLTNHRVIEAEAAVAKATGVGV